MRVVLTDLFEQEGFSVHSAPTGRDAIELARTSPSAVAILDLKLPDMDGLQLLRALRAIHPRMRFIIHTGYGTFRSAREAVNEGVFAYVDKVDDPRELIRQVHRAARAYLNHELEESRSRYLAILQAVPDVLYVLDADGRYRADVAADLSADVAKGSPCTENTGGLSVEDVLCEHEARRARLAIKRALASDTPVDHEYQVGADDEATWYSARLVRIDLDGAPGVLWVARDITDHIRVEADLLTAKAQADEVSKLKTALLANMSHEIRTPLASILGFSAIISKEVPDELQEFVSMIESSGKRLLETLNSVLDLSMLEAGSYHLSHVVVNVVDHVRRCIEVVQSRTDSGSVPVVLKIDEEVVEARIDPVCLDRIVNNLLCNAVKFTAEGQITVRVSATDDIVEVLVEDTGIGISPAFLPRIFDEFRQESTGISRLYGGSGLGLSIARRLVNLMDGDIRVESEKGIGSRFAVGFPRGMDPVRRSKVRLEPRPNAYTLQSHQYESTRRASVLVLEDNPESKRLLEYVLSKSYDVDAVVSEEEVLALAGRSTYDAVFLDINIGKARTGIDVKDALRKISGYEGTPIVALTAYALPGDREHFLHAGFDVYVSKPFTHNELLGVVAQVLNERD